MNNSVRFISTLIIIFSFVAFQGKSQNNMTPEISLHEKYKAITYDKAVYTKQNFFSSCKNDMGLSSGTQLKLSNSMIGYTALNHYKYRQYYKDIPVLGGTYILHTNEKDEVVHSNGYILPNLSINTSPKLSAEQAEILAKNQFSKEHNHPQSFMLPQDEEYEIFYDQTDAHNNLQVKSSELLIMNRDFPSFSTDYLLCYKVVVSRAHHEKVAYMIDANSGRTITSLPLIMHQSVPGEGQTKYYGLKTIMIDSIGPNNYELIDRTRGTEGNAVLDRDFNVFKNDSKFWDLENKAMDEVALDAHHCTERFYDLLNDELKWSGLDGNGRNMTCVLHATGAGTVNAYWDGDYSYFGDGDCHRGPLTTYEVVAHEFQHGVTQSTSNLVYRNESGAINESMSDIMGKALEFEEDPDHFNWFIGNSFIYNDKVDPFRSMEDPNAFRNPSFYKGEFWYDTGGVHSNSGVGNNWFYTLVEGEAGINENGDEYNCLGIGMKAAMEIAFNTNAYYLTEGSDYNAFYRNSLLVAEELYGSQSDVVMQVTEAWKAVGLPYGNPIKDLDLTVRPKEDEFILSLCSDNEFFNIEFYVLNVGSTDYEPSMGAVVDMPIQGGTPTQYVVNQRIAAGDSILVSISDHLRLSDTRDYVVRLNLEFVDYNANNNRDRIYISNSLLQKPDIEIEVSNPRGECGDFSYGINYQIRNVGCTHPAEKPITIRVKSLSGLEIYRRVIELSSDFGQNSLRFYFADLNLSSVESSYTISAEVEEDLNPESNSVEFQLATNEDIAEEFLNTFETAEDLGGKTRSYVPFGSQANLPLYNLSGDSYFATSGLNSSLFTPLCPGGPKDIFDNDPFGLYPSLEFCVNTFNFGQAALEFDLVQFQNQNLEDWEEIKELTAIVRLSYNGYASDTIYISGQDEGEVVSHQYFLPSGFVGSIKMDFFSATGRDTDDPDYLEYDVNLVDDIHIYDALGVSTDDLLSESVRVYPNPSNGMVLIESEHRPTDYKLINSQGQVVSSAQLNDNFLDLSQFPDGCYLLQLKFDSGEYTLKKLMKVRN